MLSYKMVHRLNQAWAQVRKCSPKCGLAHPVTHLVKIQSPTPIQLFLFKIKPKFYRQIVTTQKL